MTDTRVLVVEDNKAVLRTICRMLEKIEVETVAATSRAEVESILAADTNFVACLLDYCLPDAADGETLPVVLAKRIPTIVLTGRNDTETREKVMLNPVMDYIPKDNPSSFDYAVKMVQRVQLNPDIKVLVVDDSPSIRNYLRMLLKRQLFQVLEAGTADEALALLRADPDIRLVLLDHDMPGKNGVSMCSEARRFRGTADLAIIGISASQDPHMSARFLKAGADDFLNKPFNHEEFFCRVTRNIEFVENLRALARAANEDPLTGLNNRRRFFDLAQAREDEYGIAMLDIDFFKHINDQHGHDVGDEALCYLADALCRHFDGAICARMGGEEFVVLLPFDQCVNNLRMLEDFRKQLAHNHFHAPDGRALQMTVSIGYASSKDRDIYQALKCADEALYRAKQTGRNRVCFDPKINMPESA